MGENKISIHALREEGDDQCDGEIYRIEKFLSTPSARRATIRHRRCSPSRFHFYPRPPRGGRQKTKIFYVRQGVFLSTPSARRATRQGRQGFSQRQISIHALREEGDTWKSTSWPTAQQFLSTPSARRATWQTSASKLFSIRFLSTPSARRATYTGALPEPQKGISIHALREEGDTNRKICGIMQIISIHALREEGDLQRTAYSEHRLDDFYPRPPRGGRHDTAKYRYVINQFLSTPSARRATAKTETKSLFSYKLYNILHEFRRALIYNGSKNYPNHAKRLENPVRRCRKDAENSPFAPGRKTQNNSRPSCSKGG